MKFFHKKHYNIEYLIGAYALIWLVLAYYFYASGTKLKQLEEKVKILEDEKENR